MPPWINKYYILDMQPKNSFVHYLVEQGFTVFVVCWKNPDASMEEITFEDYMHDGLLAAATWRGTSPAAPPSTRWATASAVRC